MSAPDFDDSDIDLKLAALGEKATEFTQSCLFRSSVRVAQEMRRVAKAEQRLTPYLDACFVVMNNSIELLDPESIRDAAIELISLLESEDRARTIQPDLPEAEYAGAVAWLSSCAYDNLAQGTALSHGFNSDGMHDAIDEGIQVCRRTGKMQCVTCFREYAADVYRAADDLDMAAHFARMGVAHENPGPHDRRWRGAEDLIKLHLLSGRLEAAAEAGQQAWKLIETWHSPRRARFSTLQLVQQISYLLGDNRLTEKLLSSTDASLDDPPPDEAPLHELLRDQVEALAACCGGNYDEAAGKLIKWDRLLTSRGCLHEWFELRLRLLSVYRLSGNDRDLERLGDQLEAKAKAARDWLTLRRLNRIRDRSVRPTPLPTLFDLDAGPFSARSIAPGAALPSDGVGAQLATTSPMESEPSAAMPEKFDRPRSKEPPASLQPIWERLAAAYRAEGSVDESDKLVAALLDEVLHVEPASIKTADDAGWYIHTVRFLAGDGARSLDIWRWAEAMAAPFLQDASVLSVLATLGASLQDGSRELSEDVVSFERLEQMFRESLDLDPHRARNFERAGAFFLILDRLGEAERCFARGFRLDRQDSNLAQQLANVYRQTERERDALAVLDMCLREGCQDPEIAWRAALAAFGLQQFEATLTYLDLYDKLVPDAAWVNYYRAASLLELGRPSEALEAAEEEGRRNPDCPFTSAVHRASAAGALGQMEKFREHLGAVLHMRLADIDYLTVPGLCGLFRRLWLSAEQSGLPANDRLRAEFESRMLGGNLAPNEFFESARQRGEPVDGVNFYRVTCHQPLDERWRDWPGRLRGEDGWTAYAAPWGVLARSEEEAEQIALSWQRRAFPLASTVTEIDVGSEGYRDAIGAVWQGYRDEKTEE